MRWNIFKMKGKVAACAAALVLIAAAARNTAAAPREGQISVSGAFALYPLMVSWCDAYQKANPHVRIDVSAGGAGKGMADVLGNLVDIAMVSREVQQAEKAKGAWPVAVAKDAVIVVVSARNRDIEAILARGLARDHAKALWITGSMTTWGGLLSTGVTRPVNVYTRSDACGAAEVWALFLGAHQEDLVGTGVFGDPGIVEAVKNDPLGIGYGNVNFVYDGVTKKPAEGVAVVPLDIDNNGFISDSERFYGTRDDLTKAIAEGRYPSPPSRELYLVTNGAPKKEIMKQFLAWILSEEGQKFVAPSGYIVLPRARLQAQWEELRK